MPTTPTYVSPFTGTVVVPTDVSYLALALTENTQLYWPSVVNPTQVAAPRILDVTPSTSNLTILLPDATQGTLGTDILIRNYGPSVIFITDASGTQSIAVSSGGAQYFYLTDNTTVAGVWHSVAFGVGVSYADAAALAGAGLTSISGQLAVTTNIVEISSVPTLTDNSRASTYIWFGGLATITLPLPSALSAGWFMGFRNNGTGALTFAPQGSSRINGQVSVTINPGDSGYLMFEKMTGNFFTVGLANPTNVTFTAGTYDVDTIVGGTFSLVSYAPIIQTYVALSGTRTTNLGIILPQITQVYVLVNQTGMGSYDLQFAVQGSVVTPITVPAGTTAFCFSDGVNLYLLSQQNLGYFLANSGTPSVPSFSFNADTHSGMYSPGIGQLGFSANSTPMVLIDDTNTLSPQVTVYAQLNANLIAGGSF